MHQYTPTMKLMITIILVGCSRTEVIFITIVVFYIKDKKNHYFYACILIESITTNSFVYINTNIAEHHRC